MEKAKILVVYNLLNANGDKLQLRLGSIREFMTREDAANGDNGFRWSFVGRKIPMPVRAYTWFNGFPENIMLDWLKGNGWAIRSRVEIGTGKATVYELPTSNKEASAQEMYNGTIQTALEKAMEKISEAKDNGNTSCYISSSQGKIPVEVIQTLLDAGYDITYHSYGKGYGDWFVQAFWGRPCKHGKIFVGELFKDPIEVTIDDYKNA